MDDLKNKTTQQQALVKRRPVDLTLGGWKGADKRCLLRSQHVRFH